MRKKSSRVPDIRKISSPAGRRVKDVYESRFDGKRISVVKTGTLDTQDQIEAYAPFTDLNYMLHRLSVGDTSVLARSKPLYGDFSGMPDNPIDAVNMVHNAEKAFAALPVEAKQDYNNDFRVWLASLFTRSDGSPNSEQPYPAGSGSDPEPVIDDPEPVID